MPKKRFSAEQIVVLRQIEVLMSQGKATPLARHGQTTTN
jgi:putative transposase